MMNKNYAAAMNDNELAKVSGGFLPGSGLGADIDPDAAIIGLRVLGGVCTGGLSELIVWGFKALFK